QMEEIYNKTGLGVLGEEFLKRQVECGVPFDEALAEWRRLHRTLLFIIVECPEVTLYDHRGASDCQERRRIRGLAKARLGNHMSSADVSVLSNVARLLNIKYPIRRYNVDPETVRTFLMRLADAVERVDGVTETVGALR